MLLLKKKLHQLIKNLNDYKKIFVTIDFRYYLNIVREMYNEYYVQISGL